MREGLPLLESKGGLVIGKRIREIRLRLGLTQEGLGKRANLHYSYIGQVERGNKVPSIKTLHRIAAALNVNVETLLDNEIKALSAIDDILVRELINIVKGCPPAELKLYIGIIQHIRLLIKELEEKKHTETSVKHVKCSQISLA